MPSYDFSALDNLEQHELVEKYEAAIKELFRRKVKVEGAVLYEVLLY